MANSQFLAAAQQNVQTVTDNTTRFAGVNTSWQGAGVTEANNQQVIRTAGVFKNLYVRLTQNDVASATSCTVTLDVNAVASALTVSFGTSQTGVVEDITHSVTVAANDLLTHKTVVTSVPGTHTVTFGLIGMQFVPTDTTKCVISHMMIAPDVIQGTSVTIFVPVNGSSVWSNGASDSQFNVRTPMTASGLRMNVSSNGRSSTTTIGLYKNSGIGNQVVSYTAGQTGTKEDTTNTDSLVEGDAVCFYASPGTGTGTIGVNTLSVEFQSFTSLFPLLVQNADLGAGAATVAINVTVYQALSGRLWSPINSTTSANFSIASRFDLFVRQFEANILANGFTTASLRIGTPDSQGDIFLTYAAGQTGVKSAVLPEVQFSAVNDTMRYEFVSDNSGSGTATVGTLAIWLSDRVKDYGVGTLLGYHR